jgi:hypothetical protein
MELYINQSSHIRKRNVQHSKKTGRTCSRKSWPSMAKQQDHNSGSEDAGSGGQHMQQGRHTWINQTTPIFDQHMTN